MRIFGAFQADIARSETAAFIAESAGHDQRELAAMVAMFRYRAARLNAVKLDFGFAAGIELQAANALRQPLPLMRLVGVQSRFAQWLRQIEQFVQAFASQFDGFCDGALTRLISIDQRQRFIGCAHAQRGFFFAFEKDACNRFGTRNSALHVRPQGGLGFYQQAEGRV